MECIKSIIHDSFRENFISTSLKGNWSIVWTFWFRVFLLDWFFTSFEVFGNVPYESDRLKRETSWLDLSLFKSLRILVRMLFGPVFIQGKNDVRKFITTIRWNENESVFLNGRKSVFLEYLKRGLHI